MSNNTVQHAFVREFSKQSPTTMQIWTWHKIFKEEGCLCRRKGSGRQKTPEKTVEHACKKILQGLKKSLRRTSAETQIPPISVWRILSKRLIMKPYKLQLIQAITAESKQKAKTELTCAVSQAEHISNMCEIGHEIHISPNLSFKFGGVIPILFNIKPA